VRKFTLLLIAALFFLSNVPATSYANAGKSWLDKSDASSGVIAVSYNVKKNVKTKVMIAKGQESYTYNLPIGESTEFFPLQLGNGEYTVSLLENISGKSYKVLKQDKLTLKLKNDNAVYLNSVQNIRWTSTDKPIEKAKELAKGKKSDAEKVKAVYEFITANIVYDQALAKNVPSDYLPSIERTFNSKKDICYGYASLFAAMLRSLDIPTKLVMGQTEYLDVYHAWNEVYLNGKWVTIDTTLDSSVVQSKKKAVMIKESKMYTKAKEY